jgi:hypothetical protein
MRVLEPLVFALAFAVACAADEPPPSVLPGPVASTSKVRLAVQRALAADPRGGAALVQRVCDEGGPSAAQALALLCGHSAADVRLAALHGVSVLRLRCEALRAAVVEHLDDERIPAEERMAGVDALGWTGDARDVPLLLELAQSADASLAATAERSFRVLTGLVGLSRDAERRATWWRDVRRSAVEELHLALDGMESEDAPTQAPTYRTLLRLRGLHDLPVLTTRLREWFQSGDQDLRAEAARVVEALRLADLAAEVLSLRRDVSSGEVFETAQRALGALGASAAATR